VMRRSEARAGRRYYLLKASWAGDGFAPNQPFEST
jgi:hypothetical protein